MRAPRLAARSNVSRIRTPAPSPKMKPLRSASKGRLAASGLSLYPVASAVIEMNPAML